jgi:membrane-associated phospholipid phosphatase
MTKPKSDRSLHPVEDADLEVAEAVHVDRHSRKGRLLARFAELGDQPPLIALCGLVIAAGLVRRDRRMTRAGMRMLAAHAVSNALKGFVKDEIDRTRPGVARSRGRYKLTKGRSSQGELRSMPSGHSAGLAAVARAAARDYPAATLPVTAAAATVAAAQLPSGNHFASDVAVGAGIGIVSEALVAAAMGLPAQDT